MRFLVRLSNQCNFKPCDARELGQRCYEAVRNLGMDVGNLRVTSTAVELDLLMESRDRLKTATGKLEEVIGPLVTVRELDTLAPQIYPEQAVREGIELFNEERYWESHEALEIAWRQASGPEKEILQGVILTAAALVHLQKDENEVALSVLGRALEKLKGHQGAYFGIEVGILVEQIGQMLANKRVEFFTIRSYSERSAA